MPLTTLGAIITAATPSIGAHEPLIIARVVSFKSVQPEVIAVVSAAVSKLAALASPTVITTAVTTTPTNNFDAFIFYSLSSLEKIAFNIPCKTLKSVPKVKPASHAKKSPTTIRFITSLIANALKQIRLKPLDQARQQKQYLELDIYLKQNSANPECKWEAEAWNLLKKSQL
jgi:hypothetical protein